MDNTSQTLNSSARLYARLWRWHFFAALIVIPFVLWQAVTGTLYLWHREIAAFMHPALVTVPPGPVRVSYQAQFDTAMSHYPGQPVQGIEITDDPTRSTVFFFRAKNGLPIPAFVDPYTGHYLGEVTSTHWLTGLTRALHGGWPINPYGSYLLELGAGWAIVMVLTGLYLWWPRQARGFGGVLYPRLRQGRRAFWRDLHATVGVYLSLIVLVFLFTALPWTTFWGNNVLKPIQRATGQESPIGFFFSGGADHHHPVHSGTAAGEHAGHASAPKVQSLDELIAGARGAGARGTIELRPQPDGGPVNIRDEHPRSPDEVWLQLDGHSGAVLIKVTWQDFPALAKLVSLGVDLHEGHFFGRANQIFNMLLALALIWLAVTGFIGWYKRRPDGGLAAPPRRELHYPKAVIAVGSALCIALPLLGASVAGIFLIDRMFGRRLGVRR